MLRYFIERLRAVARPSGYERELAREMETHRAMLEEEHVRQGKSPEEARRLARAAFGSTAALRDNHADVRGVPWMENLWRDARFAVRALRRDRGFAMFVLLIGALGIGVSTAVFSVVNAMLLRPLPVADPAALVWVANYNPGVAGDRSSETVPVNPFLEFRKQNKSFTDFTAFFAFYEPGNVKMIGNGEPERLTSVPVAFNFFPVLGVNPILGRTITEAEGLANQPVVMLSEGFWRRRFAADRTVIGKSMTLDNRVVTVVGVMPFDFGGMLAPGIRVDLFGPLPLTNEVDRYGNTLSMIGRLRPGATVRSAQAEADVLTGPIGARNRRPGLRFTMRPLDERVRGEVRPALLLLTGAVCLVMLVLCANVSHLQLARAASRRKEVSIRVALGAGRGRLIQQLLVENVLLFGAAAVLGLGLAYLLTRLLTSLPAIGLPLQQTSTLDATACFFTALVALATGVVCGLIPALQLPLDVQEGLKETSRTMTGGRRQNRLRESLVVLEIAFACVLLVGAGLLLRSLKNVMEVRMGFEPQHAAALRVDPAVPRGSRRSNYFDDLLSRVRAVPGIRAAGLSDVIPLGGNRSWNVGAQGRAYSRENPPPDAFVRIVTDGYLTAMGIPLRAGRDLDARDREGAPPVVLVNESLARTLWPNENAVGKILKYAGNTDREVVGVVADVRHIALEKGSGNEFYLPMRQTTDYGAVYIAFRSSLGATAAVAAVREAVRPLDPNVAVNGHQVLEKVVDESVASRRMTTLVLAGFAGFALLLAALGIFGLITYSVNQRQQELGIRMALGATAGVIQGEILRETLRLAGLGMAAGMAVSLLVSRGLSALLFDVRGTDPATFAAVCGLLFAIASLAGYLPARRASRTEPGVVLRAG